ncbi:hypothetical protein BKA70DRAFT_1268317 [Coprinopsis sp. MPI-PUGE-AT-0042]|nr:hypothetical protein BKA70DRAFT_1268317 [Coprinopsis sp. MPI-PUGE-AT-0042]
MLTLLLSQLIATSLLPVLGAPLQATSLSASVFTVGSHPCPTSKVHYIYTKDYRSIGDIVWSCLSVIFASTWTAVHPNVHGYNSTRWQRTKQRTLLFMLALFMPEVNLVWSIQQWLGARDITKAMNIDCLTTREETRVDNTQDTPFEWTHVHSQFLQMGGYIFQFKEGHHYVDRRVNIAAMRSALLKRKDREEELMDRSKTNCLARTVVYGQMIWFGATLIKRSLESLSITTLEIASAAYVVNSLLTYYFWMNKPLDVDCPIVVTEETEGDFGTLHANSERSADFWPMRSVDDPKSQAAASKMMAKTRMLLVNSLRMLSNMQIALTGIFTMEPPKEWFYVRRGSTTGQRCYPPLAFLGKPSPDLDGTLARALSSVSYIAFGAVHCIAWSFVPHSNATQDLWRASLLVVTSVPPLVPLLFSLDYLMQNWLTDRVMYWTIVVALGVVFHKTAWDGVFLHIG